MSFVVAFISSSTFFFIVFQFFKNSFKLLKKNAKHQEELGNISTDSFNKAIVAIEHVENAVLKELINLRSENELLKNAVNNFALRVENQERIMAELINNEIGKIGDDEVEN